MLLLACIALLFAAAAQENPDNNPQPVQTRADYLHKAKSQKTAAIVLVSAGGALVIIGAVTAVQSFDLNLDLYSTNTNNNSDDNETLSTVLVIAGLAAILGSVGLFISSHKNKKHALAMSVKNEPVLLMPNKNLVYNRGLPSLNIRFNF